MNKPAAYITDGISQRDRYPASLDPGYFNIDERTTNDLLLFITELSFKYNYYNDQNQLSGDWLDFFLSDPHLMLRLLSCFDFAHYEAEYNRNKQQLLKADSEDKLNKVLIETIQQIWEFIIFQSRMFEKFKISIAYLNSEDLLSFQKSIDSEEAYEKARLEFYAVSKCYERNPKHKFKHPELFNRIIKIAEEKAENKTDLEKKILDYEADPDFFENLNDRSPLILVFENLFSRFDVVYNQLKITASVLLNENQQKKIEHQPHISLVLTFLELYQVLRQEMNLFTGKHLDLYYKKLLGMEARKPVPDKVSVILFLNKGVNEFLMEKGEIFLATIPGKSEKEIFRLKEDILVTQAAIAELKTIYKRPYTKPIKEFKKNETDYVVYAASNPVTAPEDFTKKNYQNRVWPLFGEDQKYLSKEQRSMQPAEMGLLISAPVLFAVDGKRTFTITIQLKKQLNAPDENKASIDPEILGKSFIIHITGLTQWIKVKEYHITGPVNGAADRLIKIEFTLRPEDPATAVYQPEVHGTGIQFKNPVIRLMLNFGIQHNPYTFLQEQEIERVKLNLLVQRSNRLQLQNNTGRVSVSNPFQLFGPIPSVGNYLDISNPDVFNRFTRNFEIILKWENIPGNLNGFTAYYEGYENNITNESFKVKLTSGIDKDETNLKKETTVSDLFQMNENEFSQYLQGSTTLSRTNFPKLRFENHLKLLEMEDANPDFRIGTVRLELVAPADAFCHQQYPVIFPKVLMHNSKWYVFKQKPSPNPPYAPVVNTVLINYELEHSEIISGRKGNDAKSQIELHHIYPFGHRKIYPQEVPEPVKLIPAVKNQCNLFIGLTDVVPGKCLTLLFQLDENNFDSLEENIQPVQWHYLNRNKWEEIDKEHILEDNTYGFKGTGTVKLLMPENMPDGNTLFNPHCYWIRISCDNENRSKVKGIFTNVATLIRDRSELNWKEGSLLLPPDRIKEFSRKVPEIKTMHQPFYSYHGQVPETMNRYYSRVSEHLRHKNRIITATDISQKILDEFPDIHKVLCFNNSVKRTDNLAGENLNVVVIHKVTVNTEDEVVEEPKVNTYGLYKIQNFLNEIISPVIKVNVCNPVYEKIKVICSIGFKRGIKYENSGILIQKLNLELRKFITPWLYDSGRDINTASGIYPGEILNFIKDQPYVDTVKGFNVVHFYKHYNADTGTTGGRLIESLYIDMQKGNNGQNDNGSFILPSPPADIKLILKASMPGAILISSSQHMITALDTITAGAEIKDEIETANTKSGIGRLAIGEEFLVMDPYHVTDYSGITSDQDTADVDKDKFNFIF